MELQRYLSVIWKWAWIIVLSVGLAAGLSYWATARQPKLYQASTQLIVGQSFQSINPNPQDFQTSAALALTYIEIAKTTPVLQSTISALGVALSPVALRERFHANVIPNTQLIELRVDDTDPKRAQAIANELAHQITLQGPAARQEPQQREFVQTQADDLQKKINDAQKTIADLQTAIQTTASARDIAAKQQQIATLDTQVTQWQQSYTQLLNYIAPRSPNYVSIVEPAQLPTVPYAPNIMLNVLLAAVVGLILSLGATLLMEYLDDSFKQADDVTHLLDLPILGTLGLIGDGTRTRGSAIAKLFLRRAPNPDLDYEDANPLLPPESVATESRHGSWASEKLVPLNAARSSQAEAYRVLRTNLQFNNVDKPLKSIFITSAATGEGKSLTAANLAIVMAQSGLRTLLIDSDLRKPTQHRLFGLINNVGLTDSLLAHATEDDYARATGVENLFILTTGALPPNPAELLASQRMRALKTRLENQMDILIFDGPPCLPVADAAILATLVDGVVLVVDMVRTHRKEAQRAKQILTQVNAHVLGVVLNRASMRGNNYYYYSDYSMPGRKRVKKIKGHSLPKQLEPRVN